MSQNKSNILLNIIYFIIVFLIIFLFIFIIYENFIKIKNPITDNTNPKALTTEQINTLGKDKFNWMNNSLKRYNNHPVFFTNSSIDATNFDNTDLLNIAYDALSNDDKNPLGNADASCFKDANGNKTTISNYPEDCYKETFDKSIIQEQINKTFTSDIKVNYTDFISSGSKACFINETKYTCILNMNDIDIASLLIITGYDHSEYSDGKLIVYSKLLTVKKVLDIYPKNIQGIYSDLDGNTKIDDLTYYSDVTASGLSSESIEKIITKYKDSITTYKSVFEGNSSGDYVWESTSIN